MDIDRLVQLVHAGDFDAAQQLLHEAGRRQDTHLEALARATLIEVRQRTRIHQGPLCEVHRLVSDNDDVCVKRVTERNDEARRTALASDWSHTNETNIFVTRDMGWCEHDGVPQPEHLEALLRAEYAVVDHAAAFWNHPGARLTHWAPGTPLDLRQDGIVGGDLCMVMPTCAGQSLSAYPQDRQRALFPSMLPALWRALTHQPHGDLSPEDLLVDESERFFRILDPGVCILGPQRLRRDHAPNSGLALDFKSVFFTTNIEHYPILKPAYGRWPTGVGYGDSVGDDLRTQVRTRLQAQPFSLSAELAFDAAAHSIFHTVQMLNTLRAGSRVLPSPIPNPRPPDIIAMGIMYVRMLTGRRFVDLYPVEWPLWRGFWSDRGGPAQNFPEFPEHLDVLTQALALAEHVTPAERTLCEDLIALRVNSLHGLLRRVHAVRAP